MTWYKGETTKLKSGKNTKVTFAKDEAKLQIIEAEGDDDGEYKMEAVNQHGTETLRAKITVISKFALEAIYSMF